MIVGISGKSQSGKDTVGKIIQYLTSNETGTFKASLQSQKQYGSLYPNYTNWQIHKFADALKNIVCILTGCTRKQLEDIDFKNSNLGDEWIRYYYISIAGQKSKLYNTYDEAFKDCPKIFHLVEKEHLTYRNLLQSLGTDLFRNQLHENTWINALFSKYKMKLHNQGLNPYDVNDINNYKYSNWIITDVRFPNEAEAIKDRGGILMRVNRDNTWLPVDSYERITGNKVKRIPQHKSEIALDNYTFDYTIDNSGTIEDLIEQVKQILKKEKII